MTLSVAEETRNASLVGNNKAHLNRGSRKDKCNNNMATAEGRVGATQPICHEDRQRKKLLCLWRFQVYGPPLQKPEKRRIE